MTQVRMAEYFMINSLDLQARFHYAPHDSSSHIAEKVMRSLNECLGGRSIPVKYKKSVFEDLDSSNLPELTSEMLHHLQNEREIDASKDCAEAVKRRCDGRPCMGTTIKSRVPWYDVHRKFFFDDEFMAKCAQASSAAVLEKFAGKEYYKFGFFEVYGFFYRYILCGLTFWKPSGHYRGAFQLNGTWYYDGLWERNHRLLLYQMSIFAKYLLQVLTCLRELTKDFRHVLSKRNSRHTT